MRASSKFRLGSWPRLMALGLMVVLLVGACAPTVAPASAPTSAPISTKAPAQPATNSIQGIVWQWISVTNQTTKETTTVPNPESYTITFNADGTLTGKADCNTFSGTYSQQNGFTIKVTPTVMSACGTMDSQYLTLLKQVAAGGPDGAGGLALETAGGEQRMLFKNGGAAPAASNNSIQGIVWQWTSVTNQTTKATTNVPNPESYTITFNADGTVTGKADCNSFSGTYSQTNGFTIKLGPSTMAYCGETSLDRQYLTLLGTVASGGPDGAGGLALETAGGEQRMLFKNGGAAAK